MVHSNCERRLKQYKDAGLVKRIERYQLLREGKKPYLYSLTPQGADVLCEHFECTVEELGWRKLDTRLRANYIEHLIMTNDVRLAIERAVEETPGIELVTWRDELALAHAHSEDKITYQFIDGSTKDVTLNPDAYFLLRSQDGQERHHFVEIDRGTETAMSSDESYRTWGRKIDTYIQYFYAKNKTTGQTYLQARYGTPNARVLSVTTSQRRMERLIEASERVGAKGRFWFAVHAELVKPIIYGRWQRVTYESGSETDVLFYTSQRPDVLHGPVWTIATKDRAEKHAFIETFTRKQS